MVAPVSSAVDRVWKSTWNGFFPQQSVADIPARSGVGLAALSRSRAEYLRRVMVSSWPAI